MNNVHEQIDRSRADLRNVYAQLHGAIIEARQGLVQIDIRKSSPYVIEEYSRHGGDRPAQAVVAHLLGDPDPEEVYGDHYSLMVAEDFVPVVRVYDGRYYVVFRRR